MAGGVTHPDRCAQYEDVCIEDLLAHFWPLVTVALVRGNAWADVAVGDSHRSTRRDAVGLKRQKDLADDLVGARDLCRRLERAVQGEGAERHCAGDLLIPENSKHGRCSSAPFVASALTSDFLLFVARM